MRLLIPLVFLSLPLPAPPELKPLPGSSVDSQLKVLQNEPDSEKRKLMVKGLIDRVLLEDRFFSLPRNQWEGYEYH